MASIIATLILAWAIGGVASKAALPMYVLGVLIYTFATSWLKNIDNT